MFAPSHWMLAKLRGVFAPRPSAGPHKLRECMPLVVLLRNRLKYALNYREAKTILIQRLVKDVAKGAKGVTYCVTHDGRTIRFPDPAIKTHDTVKVNIETGKIEDFVKFEQGNVCMISGGNNIGRVGILTHREKHPGSFEIVHLKDATGAEFCTRLLNVM